MHITNAQSKPLQQRHYITVIKHTIWINVTYDTDEYRDVLYE